MPTSFVVKAGTVSIPVYFRTRTVSGRTYPTFEVASRNPDGKRKVQAFSTEAAARAEARRLALAQASGQTPAFTLTAADADLYRRAVAILAPTGGTLLEAAAFYAQRNPAGIDRRTVAEVCQAFREDLEARGLSTAYRKF